MKIIIYLLSVAAIFSCNSTKSASDKNESSATQNTIMPDSIYRFTVSFISKGAGIDRKAKQDYDQFIIQYGQRNNVKLNYEITPWGREGENDYCFKLTEINKQQQEEFISETREKFKQSTLILYKENSVCRKSNKK